MITYNHELFIQEAIEGVLMQECDFKIELIIANDFSTDKTDEIIKNIIQKHPNGSWIRYIRHEQNLGMMPNFIDAISKCTGEFIALCEGDDYWTDPLKLQKQVDLLESNKNLVACHHWQKNAIFKDGEYVEVDSPKVGHGYYPQPISKVVDIFSNKIRIKTRTVMFRNVINDFFFPDWFYNVAFGDVPLSLLLGEYGDFGFIDEPMAVYRQTGKGVSTAGLEELGLKKFRVQHYKNWIEIWDYADIHYNFEYHKEAQNTVTEFYNSLLSNLQFSGSSFVGILKYNIINRKLSFLRTLPHTKLIILLFINKFSKKVKRKLSYT